MKRSAVIVTLSIAAMVLSSAALGRGDEVVRSPHTIQPAKAAKTSQSHGPKVRTPVSWRTGK
jgi:hypothetical protein